MVSGGKSISALRSRLQVQMRASGSGFRPGPCTWTWRPEPDTRWPRPGTWKSSRHLPPGAATRHLKFAIRADAMSSHPYLPGTKKAPGLRRLIRRW